MDSPEGRVMRSLATAAPKQISKSLPSDRGLQGPIRLVIVETPDRQACGDRAARRCCSTDDAEYGAASQLEKIDMLDSPISSLSTSSTAGRSGRACAT